ncbi:hypothetical protein D3C87_1471540 [compost metagenome]
MPLRVGDHPGGRCECFVGEVAAFNKKAQALRWSVSTFQPPNGITVRIQGFSFVDIVVVGYPFECWAGVPTLQLPQGLALDELLRYPGQSVIAVDLVIVEAEIVQQVLATQNELVKGQCSPQLDTLVNRMVGIHRSQRLAIAVVECEQFIADLAAVHREVQVEVVSRPAHAGFQGIGLLFIIFSHDLPSGEFGERWWLNTLAQVGEELDAFRQVMAHANAAHAALVCRVERFILRQAEGRNKSVALEAIVDIALLMQPCYATDQRPLLRDRDL